MQLPGCRSGITHCDSEFFSLLLLTFHSTPFAVKRIVRFNSHFNFRRIRKLLLMFPRLQMRLPRCRSGIIRCDSVFSSLLLLTFYSSPLSLHFLSFSFISFCWFYCNAYLFRSKTPYFHIIYDKNLLMFSWAFLRNQGLLFDVLALIVI